MNTQDPRVSVVSFLGWWLVWTTWPGQWKGRSKPAAGYRAGVSEGIRRSQMEWSCAEGSLASCLWLSAALLATGHGSRSWIVRPGFVLWASSASCKFAHEAQATGLRQSTVGLWMLAVGCASGLRHISGDEEAADLGPLSRKKQARVGPRSPASWGLATHSYQHFQKQNVLG